MMFLSLNSSMTGVTIEAETADPFRATEFTPVFPGSYCSVFSFLCNVLKIFVCLFDLFLMAIEMFVLRCTVSDYLFGIFKAFLQ